MFDFLQTYKRENKFNPTKLYGKLEAAFIDLGLDSTVKSHIQSYCYTRFELVSEDNVPIEKLIYFKKQLKELLEVRSIRIYSAPTDGHFFLELENEPKDIFGLSEAIKLADNEKLSVPIGIDVSYKLTEFDVCNSLLAVGSDKEIATFKEAIMASVMLQSSPKDLQILFIDAVGRDEEMYQGLPHLLMGNPISGDVKTGINALKWAVSEIERRRKLLRIKHCKSVEEFNSRYPENALCKLLVVASDFGVLLRYARGEVLGYIAEIARGEQLGMGMAMFASNYLDEVNLGELAKFAQQNIVFYVEDAGWVQLTDAKELCGCGDMLLSVGCGKPERLQAPNISKEEFVAVCDYCKNQFVVQTNSDVAEFVFGKSYSELLADGTVKALLQTFIKEGRATIELAMQRHNLNYTDAKLLLEEFCRRDYVCGEDPTEKCHVVMNNLQYNAMFISDIEPHETEEKVGKCPEES